MAASYALPPSALPHTHSHHVHSHSHSPAPLSSLRSTMTSNGGLHTHGHTHSATEGHNHNHNHQNGNAVHSRGRMPPPSLSTMDGWMTEKTKGGKQLITPTASSFPTSIYEPPDHANLQHNHHDHSAERSTFTNFLLRYTATFPVLHQIMTDKDSRRIFYFMTYEEPLLLLS
jgi:solute carrier family 30 (zinc transporter), member 5/7